MVDCPTCKNRGGCPTCRGDKTFNGRRCLICRGNGLCPVCQRAVDPQAREPAPTPAASPIALTGAQRTATATASTPSTQQGAIIPASTVVSANKPLKRWSPVKVALRALLALLVLVAFYGFAIGVILVLLFIAWAQVQASQAGASGVPLLMIVPALGALAIALAIWPRFPTWVDPGRGITERRAPELYAFLREVSRTTRQPMPRRLYLFNETNAWVANRGIFMGRAMGIGLPLFEQLTVSELRAVVAHEFGHYASRAGGLGTFVYRAVVTFMSAGEAASTVFGLGVVFDVWTELFLRLAMPISRQQELRADEMACQVAGVEATVSALTRIHAGPDGEIADPVAGWEQDLLDTHPPLRDRVALVRTLNLPARLPSDDDRPARVLLETLMAQAPQQTPAT